MTNTDTPTVRVGQVWADNDSRADGRTLRVDTIEHSPGGDVAVCTVLTNSHGQQERIDRPAAWDRPKDARGKQTRVRIDRMRPMSAGYRLVKDAPESAGTPS